MRYLTNGRYVFTSRDDVLDELVNGSQAKWLVGFECAECHSLHVADFVDLMTPFSDPRRIEVPDSVRLTVEHVDGFTIPQKLCPQDGAVMKPIRTEANARLFGHPSNALLLVPR